ncbi:MAG: PQQ-binding-like beta-propeller repeat protein [Pirellulales bacterium]|nr:PQQ-binding-like beta-propeller repeat protein [Pirellulales bacterium]
MSLRALLASVVLIVTAEHAAHAQLRMGLTSPYELSPEVRVDEADRDARAQLERIDALIANSNWEEAIDGLRKLMASHGRQLLQQGERRFVSLADECHRRIGALPLEARRLYRERVDPVAKRQYESAIEARDEESLSRLADEMFVSSFGDDALYVLGEMALERGDYDLARSRWERIHPSLRTGDWAESDIVTETRPGLPLWTAFRDIPLAEHWEQLKPLLGGATPSTERLVYPDSDLNLADVRARLALASILEGDAQRAAIELGLFKQLHPDAKGRLAGRNTNYHDALTKLAEQSAEWPIQTAQTDWCAFAGNLRRAHVAASAPDIGAMLSGYPVELKHVARSNPAIAIRRGFRPKRIGEDHERLLSYHPIIVDGLVFVCDDARVMAYDLHTGKPAWGLTDPTIYEDDEFADLNSSSLRCVGVPRYTLSAHGDRLFARLGLPATSRPPARARHGHSSSIVCLDLTAEGRLIWKLPRAADAAEFEKARWAFEGPPVSDGRRVYVGMRRSGVRPEAHVACFDAQTGRMIWRRFICSAETPARGQEDECTHLLLTLERGRLFCNTNLGAIASLETSDGKINWLFTYPRALSGQLLTPAAHWYRDLNPCIYHRGIVVAGPTDSPHCFAFDANEGQLLWQTVATAPELGQDPIHLLGVAQNHLIATGKQLWWVDVHTGKIVARSHDGGRTGPDVYGRGLLVADQVWWPMREEILVYRQRPVKTAGRLQAPIGRIVLSGRGGEATGGNLLLSDGILLIATPNRLLAFSDSNVRKARPREVSRALGQGHRTVER